MIKVRTAIPTQNWPNCSLMKWGKVTAWTTSNAMPPCFGRGEAKPVTPTLPPGQGKQCPIYRVSGGGGVKTLVINQLGYKRVSGIKVTIGVFTRYMVPSKY